MLLLVGCYLLVFVGISVVVVPQLVQVRHQIDLRFDALLPAQDAVNRLRSAAVDEETGQRGYLLTGVDSYLDPYRGGQVAAASALADLRASSVTGIDDELDAVDTAMATWRREVADPEILHRGSGTGSGATGQVDAAKGKAEFDQIRVSLDLLGQQIQDQLGASNVSLRRAVNTLIVALSLGLVAAVALTMGTWVQLRRWVTGPVTELVAAMGAVQEGDHTHPIPEAGPQELAAIGASAEEMRRRIVEELREVTRSREALRQTGPVVLLLRQELEPAATDLPAGVDFAGRFEPAVGLLAGDFYDLVPVAGGRIGFVIADVSGHGAEAGVMAVRIKYLVAAALQMDMEPNAVLSWVSGRLGQTGDMFATCVVVLVDPATGTCTYANAGHPDLLVYHEGAIVVLGRTGPLLGPFPAEWARETVRFDSRALLVAVTDGLLEARDDEGRQFGDDRLRQLVLDHCDDEVEVVAGALVDAVTAFAPGGVADDLTVGVIAIDPQQTEPPRS